MPGPSYCDDDDCVSLPMREGTCMHLVQEAIDGSEVEVCKVH